MTGARPLLPKRVVFGFFATSYLPLFLLVIMRQLSENVGPYHAAPISVASLLVFVRAFGMATVLGVLALAGSTALYLTLRNFNAATDSGLSVVVTDVKNRNHESISYISTYIIPFLFNDYSSWFSITALTVLLAVIYVIYANSTLILINPILNLWYTLYDVDYEVVPSGGHLPNRVRSAMIVTRVRYLEEGTPLSFHRLGHKLFFAADAAENPESARGGG